MAARLGLAAVALHALVPLAGMMAFGVPAAAHAHSGSGHAHGGDHAADGSHVHESALGTGASLKQAPAAPDSFCIGDCPCCTSSDRTAAPAASAAAALVATNIQERPPSLDAIPPIIQFTAAPLARGPPRHS